MAWGWRHPKTWEMDVPAIDQLRTLEMRLQDPAVRRDPARVEALVADDFIEFGSSGWRRDRTAILNALEAEGALEYSVESDSYALQVISEDAALLTYRSFHRLPDGRAERFVNRSSLWQKIYGNWRMRFHQGTPAA